MASFGKEHTVVVERPARARAEALNEILHCHAGALRARDVEHDSAVRHHQRAVAERERLRHVVRHHQAGDVMLHTLLALPQGVEEMSADVPGLVQTSLNLGVMHLTEDGLHFPYSIRSCIASQKAMLAQSVHAIVEFAGGTVSERGNYPGWQYERDSKLRELVLGVYRDLTGAEAKLEATHGGLECGLFIEKIPGLDAISLGPELHDVHSVRERLSVPSTERVYELVCEVLRRSR